MENTYKYQLLSTSDTCDQLESTISNQNKENIELCSLKSNSTDKLLNQTNDIDLQTVSKKYQCLPLLGLFYAFLSCCFFSIGSVLTKLCRGSLNSFQVTLIRCLVQLLFCMSIITYNRYVLAI